MRCSNCGAENEGEPNFCSDCGVKFVPIPAAVPVPGDETGLYYCCKHKKEQTRVTCGRCERPICTKCMMIGHAGVRCKQCAKGKVGIRPAGVAHDVAGGLKGLFGSLARTPGGLWIMWIVVMAILGSLCGRR